MATPPQFSTHHNKPPGHLSYIDTEVLTADWGFSGYKGVDLEFSPYDGGRDIPKDPFGKRSPTPTWEIQAGLFNLVGWNLFRTGITEKCCSK